MTSSSAASSGTEVTVADHPENSRFEAFIDGQRVGLADYRLSDGAITFTHTVVDAAGEGKGVGSTIASAALDAARDRGLRVVPECTFIARYISRHDEYLELVDESDRQLVEQNAG
ncbi:MAG TPA: GNAT family N-acetyltransferase [Frankiaceae bacterium]|nr:GNAT family N-acetyltransferase [Frankiaceae bacterium]